jgi:tetratricopeptide (TPR) repeat protein
MALVASNVASGQEAFRARTSEPSRPRFEDLRKEGFEALYNLDYDGANRRFKELARLFPEHPAGPQFLAAALWAQTLNGSRRLQASLYSSDSFYAKTEDKVDPRTVEQFRELTRAAKQLAESRLKRDPRDVEALYFLGAAEGLRAAFAAAVQRSFKSALGDGSRCVDHHRQVLQLDPNFHDAELTIGLYDYTVGSLPLPVKLLVSLGGVRGSKKRGLETLVRVTNEGQWARDDARALLIVLYKREKRFDEALAVSRELSARYPRNYLIKLESTDALISLAAVERKGDRPDAAATAERQAFNIFDALLRDRASAPVYDLIHFQYGEALFQAGQWERAAKEFLAVPKVNGAEQGLVTMAHLRAAQSLDLLSKRNEALAHYRIVLARPDVYNAHEEAKRGLREPYKI